MNDPESRLAELLKAGVGDPPHRVTVQAVRRQRARRQGVAALAAAAAIAVVAVISAGISGRLGNPRPAASPTVTATPVPCRPGWSVTRGAVLAGHQQDRLVAIAGSGSDDLWAVGDVLEHWDGRRWAHFAGASPRGRQVSLASVAAVAADDVWAVGNFAPVGLAPSPPLIEHWNGRSWSLQATVALHRLTAAAPLILTSVAALGPDDVWVLGHPSSGPADVYLHWSGTSWHLFNGPNLVSPNLGVGAMLAIGADHFGSLWAVGGWMRGHGEAAVAGGGVLERWNGRQWTVARRSAWREPLTMMAPIAPGDVWAIAGGSFTTGGINSSGGWGVSPVQVLHWNGSTWKVELSLGRGSSIDPTGIVALSADDAYVIGQDATTQRPFIEHWDGTRWRSVPLGPAGHIQPLGPNSLESRSPSMTVTSDGSIAALDTEGLTDRTNFLWLRCRF